MQDMSEKVTILLLGATGVCAALLTAVRSEVTVLMLNAPIAGYIGGSILNRLLTHPRANSFTIIALVRTPAKAKLLDDLGVKAVVASMSDHDKVESLASCAHIILNAVSRRRAQLYER